MNKKFAYITLLTNDKYAHMVLALFFSLKAVLSKYELYCIITPEVSDATIAAFDHVGLKYFYRPQYKLPDNITEINSRYVVNHAWSHCFNKFWMFELPFDKIVYLDSDIFVAQNIDEMFNYQHMSAVQDLMGLDIKNGYTTGPMFLNPLYKNYFNAGVLVIEPGKDQFELIKHKLAKWVDYQCNDQNFLALSYCPSWNISSELHLSVTYNFMAPWAGIYVSDYNFDVNNVKIWHFCGKKPLPEIEDLLTLDDIATPVYNAWKTITSAATELLGKFNVR